MYYEERLIDGRLMYRSTPDGVWNLVDAEHPPSIAERDALRVALGRVILCHIEGDWSVPDVLVDGYATNAELADAYGLPSEVALRACIDAAKEADE